MIVRELITLLGFQVEDAKMKSYINGMADVQAAVQMAANAVKFLVSTTVGAAGEMEQTAVAFEVMLGSADKAKQMIAEIYEMGAKTPYESGDLINASKTLLNFGMAAESVLPTMSRIGDIAAGDAQKLQSLSLAFAQMNSAGKLSGQDLLQMINAGFNPLLQIAFGNDWDKANTAEGKQKMAQLRKQMEGGQIGADMVAKAFQDATSEGGRFFGMMQKQSETFLGRWSTMVDGVKMLAIGIGQELLPSAKEFLEFFTERFEGSKDAAQGGIVKVLKAIGLLFAVIMVIIDQAAESVGGWDAIINAAADSIAGLIGMITSLVIWAYENKEIVLLLAAVIGGYILGVYAAAAATAVYNAVMSAGAFIIGALQAKTLLATAAQWLWNAALSANPIGLVVMGIAALIAIGALLYANWDKVKAFFIGLWNGPLSGKVIRALIWPFLPFIYLAKTIIDNWDSLKQYFSRFWDWIGEMFAAGWDKIKPIIEKIQAGWAVTKEFFSSGGPAPDDMGTGEFPAYASGSYYIPNDGLAMLHRGEKVLTRDQVNQQQIGRGGPIISPSVSVSVELPPGSTLDHMRIIEDATKRAANEAIQSMLLSLRMSAAAI